MSLTFPEVVEARRYHGNSKGREKVRRLVQLEREGLPRVAIAERLGMHPNSVTNWVRTLGLPLHNVGARARKLRLEERSRSRGKL